MYHLKVFTHKDTDMITVNFINDGLIDSVASFANWKHFLAHHDWLIRSGIRIFVYGA